MSSRTRATWPGGVAPRPRRRQIKEQRPGRPFTAGVQYPFTGLLLSPMIAAAAMSPSSVPVIGNALRLRAVRL